MVHKPGGDFTLIARFYCAAELHGIQPAVQGKFPRKIFHKQRETGLGHDLAQDNARHNGIAGEVSLTEKRFFRNGETGMRPAVFRQFRPVQQEHGLPVGDNGFYLFAVHPLNGLKARQALCPPKPKELERPSVSGAFTATLGV